MNRKTPITPDTKVAELLEAYPELEETLIAAAPPFQKLTNPVLRRTIARVTSLRRAAEVGGISARDLVIRLREAAGLDAGEVAPDLAASEGGADGEPESWVDRSLVRWTIDADSLLESDQQPISEVQRRASTLTGRDIGLILSSFRPAPLIEMLESRGYLISVVRSEKGFSTFVRLKSG